MNWINKKNVLVIVIAILIVVTMGKLYEITCLTQENSFTAPIAEAKKTNQPVAQTKQIMEIEVRFGWSLSEIALDLGTDWREVAKLNNLKNPDLIYPGQKLKVIPFNKNNIKKASWYGKEFHGKPMAPMGIKKQRPFNMYDPTIAAHKWLPPWTNVRLTRIDNNKNIIVTIQDRGPYHENRCFDLSYAAAQKLGFVKEGTTYCMIEILN